VKTDLLRFSEHGGCSSKIPPGQLEEILKFLPVPVDPDILVNIDTRDDAGVYRLNDDLALVFTTDFFPPVCSDPYEYGQIAAANSISDVYAMGGTPLLALNIMMFPATGLPMEAYAEILKGGYDKAAEAGVKIIGGHTIDDQVPKYGLAVLGIVKPEDLITNAGAKEGDKLILTKPVGTGIIMAGHRLLMASDEELEEAKSFMKMLNMKGAAIMKKYNISGATDITGFGLAGHALKMAMSSKVSMKIDMRTVPLLAGTMRLVDEGCIPGACFTNLTYAENLVTFSKGMDYNLKMIAFDAQTSGGLLISVAPESAPDMVNELISEGLSFSSVIGEVAAPGKKLLDLVS
jgi:selenide, water dikinase